MSNNTKFDVRVVERHLKKGIITQKELQQHLDSLPDTIDKGIKIGTGETLDPEEFKNEEKD